MADYIIEVPAGYPWTPTDFDVTRTDGIYSTSYSWASAIPATVKTRYVDLATGDDALNGGTSWADAWKTIQKAVTEAIADNDIRRVYVKAGHYRGVEGWDNTSINHDFALIASGGTAIISTATTGLVWSVNGTFPLVYEAAVVNADLVVDFDILDAKGFGTRYVQAANLAGVNAATGTYYSDGTKIYVRRLGDAVPTVNTEVYIATIDHAISSAASDYYLEGIQFRAVAGSAFQVATLNQLVCVDCDFLYGKTHNGLRVAVTNSVRLLRCNAVGSNFDGFNYHDTVDVLEDACYGCDNGFAKTSINQGSSIHEAGNIIRVGGQYFRNNGPCIQDIDTSHAWCIGCDVGDPWAVTTFHDSGFYTDNEMWLHDCSSVGCTYDLYEGGAGAIYVYDTTYISTFGTIIPYIGEETETGARPYPWRIAP